MLAVVLSCRLLQLRAAAAHLQLARSLGTPAAHSEPGEVRAVLVSVQEPPAQHLRAARQREYTVPLMIGDVGGLDYLFFFFFVKLYYSDL